MPISIFEGHEAEREYFDSIDISGYTCMEEDYLYKGYKGSLGVGDYVIVENVGSYSVVFKPPFILPNVSIISLIDGEIHIIKNRETYKDVFTTYNLP
jgi:diaminopimelate decarboxylase